MGLYDRYILPHVINWGCGLDVMTEQRRRIVPQAQGRVLEIGIGSGLNLCHYDASKVESLTGIDPSQELLALAEPRVRAVEFPVQLLADNAEQIPLPAQSFDTLVVTFTLCSIPRLDAALAEMRRLLKPDGRLLFSEHGRSHEPAISRWQDRLNPLWNRIAGGCNLNRDMRAAIARAGFRIEELQTGYIPKVPLKIVAYQYTGIAVPD